jgi:tetratricopeptide (TPR) repeat protein
VQFGVLLGDTPDARAEAAQRLAARINAHVVIYGYLVEPGVERDDANGATITTSSGKSLHLDFYYAGDTLRGEPDTVVGRHVLSEEITFPAALEGEPMAVQEFLNEPLGVRARVLFWLTVALIFDATDQQARALQTLQAARDTLVDWDDDEGQALLHYFIGREAFWLREYDIALDALAQAIELKPNYANAYIALGAVHYDRAQLFYTPQPIPTELEECITLDHVDRAAQSAAEAVDEIDLAIGYLERAVSIAPDSPWPPIEFPARLALGHAYRLKGQAYLLGAQPDLAGAWFTKSRVEFDVAQAAFDEAEQQQYRAWTHLGRGATLQLQGYTALVSLTPESDATTVTAQRQLAADLFARAEDECVRCLEIGRGVADLVYQKKVLECGCEYLQGLAQATHAEVQRLLEEQ